MLAAVLLVACWALPRPAAAQDEAPTPPSEAVRALVEGDILATFGELHPKVLDRMGVKGPAVAFTADGDGPRTLAGVLPTDLPLRVGPDGRELFVQENRRQSSLTTSLSTFSRSRKEERRWVAWPR